MGMFEQQRAVGLYRLYAEVDPELTSDNWIEDGTVDARVRVM